MSTISKFTESFFKVVKIFSPIPEAASRRYNLRVTPEKGFRFPAPGSQPDPVLPDMKDPANKLYQNAYYKRAAVPPVITKVSRDEILKQEFKPTPENNGLYFAPPLKVDYPVYRL